MATSSASYDPFGAEPQDRGRGYMAGAEGLGSLGSGNSADKEGEYNSLELMKINLNATRMKIKALGIDDGSGKNPGGVKMSLDEFVITMRLKDPSTLTHEGKSLTDPIEVEEIAGSMGDLVPGYAGMDDATKAAWTKRYEMLSLMMQDPQMSGDTIAAMQGGEYADAVAYWKTKGVIDSQNNQNAGQIGKLGQKLGKIVVENRVMSPLTPEEEKKWRDQYEAETGAQKVDPKNIKKEHIGEGRVRTTVLNEDGSVAVQFIDGDVTLPNGQQIPITITGQKNSDMDKAQDLADGTGGLYADAAAGKHPSQQKRNPKSEDAVTDDPLAENGGTALDDGSDASGGDGMDGGGSQDFMDDAPGGSKPKGKGGPFDPTWRDDNGDGLDDASAASANDMYSAQDLQAVGNGLDSTGDPLADDFDENGNPILFNQGDPMKEHYQNEKGDAVLTGGKGLPSLDGGADDGDGTDSENPAVDTDTAGDGTHIPGPDDAAGGSNDSDDDGIIDQGFPGAGGPVDGVADGVRNSPGGQSPDVSGVGGGHQTTATVENVLPYVPGKFRKKVEAFWSDALREDPELSIDELISMLPDDIQYTIGDRIGRAREAGDNEAPGVHVKPKRKKAPTYEDSNGGYQSNYDEGDGSVAPEEDAAPAKAPSKSKKKPKKGSSSEVPDDASVEELLALLKEHPELAGPILDALKQAQGA